MCGIAGIVSMGGAPVDPAAIKRMCDAIAHRGPDDCGYTLFRLGEQRAIEGGYWCEFVDPEFRHVNEHLPIFGGTYYQGEISKSHFSVALGHRRLSIIDLTHYGHQPMSSSDRRYWVTFNGEIYNFPQLRDDLSAKGHVFRTVNDTEVLLHLWEEYRTDCLPMLDGMFAFAIYDRVKNRLTLARDRFGVKPVYYAISGGFLVFASETKAILASGLVAPEIDPSAVVEYFTFQNTFRPQTLFSRVNLLQAGEFLKVTPGEGAEASPRKYHTAFPSVDPSLNNLMSVSEQVADAFSQAVKRQLISDVEVGSYLSGGMDSGSIVSIAGRSIPRLATFTAGFDLTNVDGIEQAFDEREVAQKLSYIHQTEHYDVVLHAGDMPAVMERLTWHMDDPRVGMCHPNWYVAKLASKFVKVCLAGAGGDELFAGYPWRYRQGLYATNIGAFDDDYFRYWQRFLSLEEMRDFLSPDLRGLIPVARESFQNVMAGAPPPHAALTMRENLLLRALYFEFKTFMHGYLITEDKISMAHGLETRVPFLDNALADLAWRIPPSLKVNAERLAAKETNTYIESTEGKIVLRKAMEKFLPQEYTRLRKQGFSSPDENWYRGPSMEYIKEFLLDRRTKERPWFNQDFVQAKLKEHFDGKRNNRLLVWSLMSFEWLQRHYIDHEPTVSRGNSPCRC